ncbi:MAG TPA: hypothetical protein PK419_04305 [Spirochaetota bacterium]|jgi:co-chaperonin GroES (HSP10)|nr:hypothetical protein [Spirochaetota bacterium]HOH37048.1 hypothetical protein [Spirochaetota bacterium]HOU83496.1 hypothetical protein [Spirochaetota bacterium]HPY02121.1 hypothetical protein [Spirochaetota bacterium]HQA52057.1 hypothetical protein [Spirochaetota bacterium]
MKKFLVFIMPLMILSCSKNVRQFDLSTKMVFGGTFLIEDEDTRNQFIPKRIYFKKLDDANDLKKGVIIPSEIKDDKGNIVINYEPGIYTVVAVVRQEGTVYKVGMFNEELMNKVKFEVKAGETKIFDKVFMRDYRGSILGKPSDLQNYNKGVIERSINFSAYDFRLAVLNTDRYRVKKSKEEKAKEIEAKKGEIVDIQK